jgi:2-phosphosulfolactate phosphatase
MGGSADQLLIGGMSNIRAVAGEVFALGKPVVFICAGTEGFFSIEDTYAAGCMAAALVESGYSLSDAAWAAALVASRPVSEVVTPETCRHYRTLLSLGFGADVDFAMKMDTTLIVPRLHRDGWIS